MTVIAPKSRVRPADADRWPELTEAPRVVDLDVPQDDWSELGDLAVGK